MEKRHLDRRLAQMEAEGTRFRAGVDVGVDITGHDLREPLRRRRRSPSARPCPRPADPGPRARRRPPGDGVPAAGQPGRSRATCVRAADQRRRQARRHHRRRRHRRRLPRHRAPAGRARRSPSSRSCRGRRTSGRDASRGRRTRWSSGSRSAHEEGGERVFARQHRRRSSATTSGRCARCESSRSSSSTAGSTPVAGTEREIPADLVLLAMGFTGPEPGGLLEQLGVELDARGNVAPRRATTRPACRGVFVAGDAGRGQSLIVWAIAEGRSCAAAVDALADRRDARCRRPIAPTARPLVA